jgi:nitrate reductase NapE component
MVKKGMRIAIISNVVVLFPNLFPLLSIAVVMKGLGQKIWNPKVVFPSMSDP